MLLLRTVYVKNRFTEMHVSADMLYCVGSSLDSEVADSMTLCHLTVILAIPGQ